jgi:hypothetical protein
LFLLHSLSELDLAQSPSFILTINRRDNVP